MFKTLKTSLALLFAVAMFGLVSSPAKALVTWTTSGGKLVSAQNVDIGGTLYNVEFGDGTCVAVFDGCDNAPADFGFTTYAEAAQAAQALLDQVLVNPVLVGGSAPLDLLSPANFDSQPNLTQGCTLASICLVWIPYALPGADVVKAAKLTNYFLEVGENIADGTSFQRTLDFGGQPLYTWAKFSVVPLPPALLLFLSGLVAFFGIGRVGRRAAKAEA